MNQLKKLRGENNQDLLAKAFGITQTHYGYLERGIRTPSLALAKRISEYYNLSIEEIFFRY